MTEEQLEVARTIVAQIGQKNIWAISGGPVFVTETGIMMKAGAGYRVLVDLMGNDTYTVRRQFVRGGKTFEKGEVTDVYCEEVGEIAYYASCFTSHPKFSAEGLVNA